MGLDTKSWTAGKICGALRVLAKAGAFRVRNKQNLIMWDLSQRLDRMGTLTMRQIDYVRFGLPRYARQLSELPIIEMDIATSSTGHSVKLHNRTRFRIYIPHDSSLMEQVKRLTDLDYHKDRGFFTCEATKRNGHVLLNSLFVLDDRVQEFMKSPARPLATAELPGLLRTPKQYQLEGVAFLRDRHGRAILADEMGLGKSGQAIMWAKAEGIPKTCCIVPASVKANWEREIKLWTGDESVLQIYGQKPSQEMKAAVKIARWVIINYDLLPYWKKTLRDVGFSAYILDEVQAIKNTDTKRTLATQFVTKKAEYVVALSGTPFENRPIELFPILQIIDPALFPLKMQYASRFCDLKQDKHGFQNMSGASNTKELHSILCDTCFLRRRKTDVLTELPEKTRAVMPLELSKSQLREYWRAEVDFKKWLKGQGKTVKKKAEAIVQVNALKRLIAKAKLPLVMDWIDTYLEAEDKLVVFAHHHDMIDALKEKYGKAAVVIDGRVPVTKRLDIVDQFQNDPKIQLFIGNIKAAGVGLTLTAAKDTLTIELAWTSTAHDQAEDRCFAAGQRVLTPTGGRVIESVVAGDFVIGGLSGKPRKVLDAWSTKGTFKMARISVWGGYQDLVCTADHKLLLAGGIWKNAGELKRGDQLAFCPVGAEENLLTEIPLGEECRLVSPTFTGSLGGVQRNGRYIKIPSHLPLTNHFLFMCGYYLGDGFVTDNRCVRFAGNLTTKWDSLRLIRGVVQSFGFAGGISVSKATNSVELCWFSKEMATWFLLNFGTGCRSKKFASFIYDLSQSQLKAFWEGLLASDGHCDKSNPEQFSYSSSSLELAESVAWVAARLGFLPTIKYGGSSLVYVVGSTKNPQTKYRMRSGKVRSVELYEEETQVYDLSVEEDHSFIVDRNVVHNCHRIGQRNAVTAYYLIVEKTIEQRIATILDRKRGIISEILDGEEPVDADLLNELLKEYREDNSDD